MTSIKKINISQPFLPPLDELNSFMTDIWDTKNLTNNSKYHRQLEEELAGFLGIKYISLFNNGTNALLTALQALELKGEVITTPFTFAATPNSIWWNNLRPVFCDIEPEYYNLDCDKIESRINDNTCAIMPVHVFGSPCNVDRIKEIADKYNLKVIYDACHAFGVKYNGQSILNYGDLSVLSFHATKVYNTFEGGAVVSNSEEMKNKIDKLKNFGLDNENSIIAPGLNGKMNEFQAAVGLLQLKHMQKALDHRKEKFQYYVAKLNKINGIKLLPMADNVMANFAYFPIVIDENQYGHSRDFLFEKFKDNNIIARKYFYPCVSRLSPFSNDPSAAPELLPIAEKVSQNVLCLPLHTGLSNDDCNLICSIISSNYKG